MSEIIDDMHGMFTHASEAYDSGRRTGRHDAFSAAIKICGQISAKHEGEQSPLAFHAAEECCKALRELWEKANRPRAEEVPPVRS